MYKWMIWVLDRVEDTRGLRDKHLRETGSEVKVLREIFRQADEKFGHPKLPGD